MPRILNTISPDEIIPAGVELAKISEVDVLRYTAGVVTETSNRELLDLPFATPYKSAKGGFGLDFMPDVGDMCYVCTPGDGTGTFILAFIPNGRRTSRTKVVDGTLISDDTEDFGPDYSDGRPPLDPGEFSYRTIDGNFIHFRRGGLLSLGAGPMSQTMYFPMENLIRNFFQKMQGVTPLGNFEWSHAVIKDEIDDNDSTGVVLKLGVRDVVQDENISVEVCIGNITKDTLDEDEDSEHFMMDASEESGLDMLPDDGLVSITINPNKAGVKYTFQIDKLGNNFIRTEAGLHIEVVEGVYIKAEDGIKLERSKDAILELTNSDEFKLAVNKAVIEAVNSITLKSQSTTVDSQNVKLGKGPTYGSVIIDNGFISWLAGHTHEVTTSLGVVKSTPATNPVPNTVVAQNVKAS